MPLKGVLSLTIYNVILVADMLAKACATHQKGHIFKGMGWLYCFHCVGGKADHHIEI